MRDLTKWPRLLVAGQRVSEDRANEILVRTDSWYLTCNDREWQAMAYAAAELPTSGFGWPEGNAHRQFGAEMGILDLAYLHNDRIASSWIGGPHGWCAWSGQIGCSTFNIGKWPSTEAVTSDWTSIAAAFPYLDLTAQLISEEGEGELVGQWTVKDGLVEYEPSPTEPIRPADELEPSQILAVMLPTSYGRERGTDIGRLSDAIRQVRNSRPAVPTGPEGEKP